MAVTGEWYEYLKAARRIAARGHAICSASMVSELDLKPVKTSSAIDIASGYLNNLVKWGYLRRSGTTAVEGSRWMRAYEVTGWGGRFRPKP